MSGFVRHLVEAEDINGDGNLQSIECRQEHIRSFPQTKGSCPEQSQRSVIDSAFGELGVRKPQRHDTNLPDISSRALHAVTRHIRVDDHDIRHLPLAFANARPSRSESMQSLDVWRSEQRVQLNSASLQFHNFERVARADFEHASPSKADCLLEEFERSVFVGIHIRGSRCEPPSGCTSEASR